MPIMWMLLVRTSSVLRQQSRRSKENGDFIYSTVQWVYRQCNGGTKRETTLMIDAGFSAKRIDELLAMRELTGNDIDGILVTHEHSDHIKGLGAMARKYDLPIYANTNTWGAIEKELVKYRSITV